MSVEGHVVERTRKLLVWQALDVDEMDRQPAAALEPRAADRSRARRVSRRNARQLEVEAIDDNVEHFASLDDYVACLRSPNKHLTTWGCQISLQALAMRYSVRIWVYSSASGMASPVKHNGVAGKGEPLRVVHHPFAAYRRPTVSALADHYSLIQARDAEQGRTVVTAWDGAKRATFHVVWAKGDGNCMFAALGMGLELRGLLGSGQLDWTNRLAISAVRHHVADFVLTQRSYFAGFIASGFKDANQWRCERCTLLNRTATLTCVACGALRPLECPFPGADLAIAHMPLYSDLEGLRCLAAVHEVLKRPGVAERLKSLASDDSQSAVIYIGGNRSDMPLNTSDTPATPMYTRRIQIQVEFDITSLMSRQDARNPDRILPRDYAKRCKDYATSLARSDVKFQGHEFHNFHFLVGYDDANDDVQHVDVCWPNTQHGVLLAEVPSPVLLVHASNYSLTPTLTGDIDALLHGLPLYPVRGTRNNAVGPSRCSKGNYAYPSGGKGPGTPA